MSLASEFFTRVKMKKKSSHPLTFSTLTARWQCGVNKPDELMRANKIACVDALNRLPEELYLLSCRHPAISGETALLPCAHVAATWPF